MNVFALSISSVLDFIANHAIGFSFSISIVTMLIFGVLLVIQTLEWINTRDFLNRYRGFIWGLLVVSFLAMIPVAYYLYLRLIGVDAESIESIRNLATVSARLGTLAQALSLAFIFFYRAKEK